MRCAELEAWHPEQTVPCPVSGWGMVAIDRHITRSYQCLCWAGWHSSKKWGRPATASVVHALPPFQYYCNIEMVGGPRWEGQYIIHVTDMNNYSCQWQSTWIILALPPFQCCWHCQFDGAAVQRRRPWDANRKWSSSATLSTLALNIDCCAKQAIK